MQRLALLGEPAETQGTTEARDLHCLLVTVSKLGLRPAPPPPGTWARVCQQSGAGRCAPAQRSATLGMSRGQPASLQASSLASYFEPACFPHGSPGRGPPHPLLGAPAEPLFSPSHRTLIQTPGKATAWWRWPVTAEEVGGTTSGFPTSPSRNALRPRRASETLAAENTKPHKYLTPPSLPERPQQPNPVRPSGAGSWRLKTEGVRGRPRGGKTWSRGRRPRCEGEDGTGPAGGDPGALRPGDRADPQEPGSCLLPPYQGGPGLTLRGGVGLTTAAPPFLRPELTSAKKRALVGLGSAARPDNNFRTSEQGLIFALCTHELPACKLSILTIYFVTCTCYLNH